MKIEKIAYVDLVSELVATILSSKFNIEKCRYDRGPNTIILGFNMKHYYAETLSNLPIVVFDQHTDMLEGNLLNASWLYRRAKWCEVHLVMPSYPEYPNNLILPTENKDKFHIYTVKECKTVVGKLDSGETYQLEALKIKELESLRDLKKEISFDFDFLRDIKIEDAVDMIESIGNEEDLYDFWLDSSQDFDICVNQCSIILEKLINTN